MSTSQVLEEYLVKLGFSTDQVSFKKFEDQLTGTEKKIFGVGAAVAGTVVAVEAAASAFAYSMRKMYFASELSNTSVKNLNSLEFAGKQVGISEDAMGSSIHNVAQSLRLNPGLKAYAQSLTGISTEGKEAGDVLLDLVKATKKFPEYIGAQMMAQFGVDADTYHQMRDHLDELIKKRKENLELYKQAGFDPDKSKEAILEYTQAIDKLESRLGILAQTMLVKTLPVFTWVSDRLDRILRGWQALVNGKAEEGSAWDDLMHPEKVEERKAAAEAIKSKQASKDAILWEISHNTLTPEEKKRKEEFDAKLKERLKSLPSFPHTRSKEEKPKFEGLGNYQGLADLIAQAESGSAGYEAVNRGQAGGYKAGIENLSDKTLNEVLKDQAEHKYGAAGRYQVMPNTLREGMAKLGLSGDEKFNSEFQDMFFKKFSIEIKHPSVARAIEGEEFSSNDILTQLSNEWAGIKNSHNIGTYDKVGVNKATVGGSVVMDVFNRTRLNEAGGGTTVHQTNNTTINVTAGKDAKATGDAVADKQSRVYQDSLRHLKGMPG
jgi:hypothetical protein